MFEVLIMTAIFAVIVTFHNSLARYLYALGRQCRTRMASGIDEQRPGLNFCVAELGCSLGKGPKQTRKAKTNHARCRVQGLLR